MSKLTRKQYVLVSTLVMAMLVAAILQLGVLRPSHSDAHQRHANAVSFESRTLDGTNNNTTNPTWGQAGTDYARLAPARYADGVSTLFAAPNSRFISNRIFNDQGQNLFSENNISQWGWAWGQFVDHDMGLRDETPGEDGSIPFDQNDPLESFSNTVGSLMFNRTPAAPGTGANGVAREQINTLSSFIDASNVYGTTQDRATWLANPNGTLFMPHKYLPLASARGDVAGAPVMDLMGRLTGNPADAVVAGDVRANENIALTSIQTLFAREHNHIVRQLPHYLSGFQKYNIARRVVGAEVEYVTYNEFLPALGVNLLPYTGYKSDVNPTITNEFAAMGFRAHSMVHGEFEVQFADGEFCPIAIMTFASEGIKVNLDEEPHSLVIPLSVAFGNPSLLTQVGEGKILAALAGEKQYKNDEQIDNTMRSVLFEIPKPGTTDPTACQTPVVDDRCFTDVSDLGADDIERGRDHGIPTYNEVRKEFGLAPVTSFTQITGEKTASMKGHSINGKHILDFLSVKNEFGQPVTIGDPEGGATSGVRRTTLAARLKAIYGSVDNIDAFVGMVSEKHIPGTEFGELQQAIWRDQFTRLRDGDRFFYGNDPALGQILQQYGITFQHSLADIISTNSTATFLNPDVFHVTQTP